MPCMELRIDNYTYRIDSPDRELCGKWITDLLTLFPPQIHTNLQLRVWPFYLPHPEGPHRELVPDWNADTRRLDLISAAGASGPAGAARLLAKRLTDFAAELGKTP